MLLFDMFTRPVEINSEKPNRDKEFERMNKIANIMMILNEISSFISENLEFLEWIRRRIAADMIATRAGENPKNMNTKVDRIMTIVIEKYFLFWITIPGSSISSNIFLFRSVGFSSFFSMNQSIKKMVDTNVIINKIPILARY
ncbi:hypothetical protein ES703_70052 [subsurface metagenome]